MSEVFSIVLRSAEEQAQFDALLKALTESLGLDWRGMSGEPDGSEVAVDCAETLWAAGFRVGADLRAELAATRIKLTAARLALAACREVREARES